MFENIGSFFKKIMKPEQKELLVEATSKDAAKERLHIVLMQDRANVSADFLELMKQEIIDVIKKYIVIDEEQIDVRLTNQENDDGTTGAPALYANIPIINIRNDVKGEYLNQESKEKSKSGEENINNNINEKSMANNKNIQNINKIENNIDTEKIKESSNKNNVNMEKQNEYDEEGEDITFDDLLKVAEEEKQNQEKKENKTENDNDNDNDNVNEKVETEKSLSKSIKTDNITLKKSTRKKVNSKNKNNKSNKK